jgi:hypothetical protein
MELLFFLVAALFFFFSWVVKKGIGNSRNLLLKRLKKGGSLEYANAKFKDDFEIVKIAIQTNPENFKHASPRIANNPDLNLELIAINPAILGFVSDSFLRETGNIIRVIHVLGAKHEIWQYLSIQKLDCFCLNIQDILKESIQVNPLNFRYVSLLELRKDLRMLRNDLDVVLSAVSRCGQQLKYASTDMRDNYDVVLAAVRANDGDSILSFASERMRNERAIVQSAIEKNGLDLQYASNLLKSDFEMCLKAVSNNYKSFAHVSLSLRNNDEFVLECLKSDVRIKEFLSDEMIKRLRMF